MLPTQQILEKLTFLRAHDTLFRLFGSDPKHGWGHAYQLEPVVPESEVLAFEQAVGLRLPEDFRTFIVQVCNGGPGPGYGLMGLPSKYNDDFLNELRRTFDPSSGEMTGCLTLFNHGCGVYEYLVVNSDQHARGQIVGDNGYGDLFWCGPFLEYYMDWLDGSIAEISHWEE